MSTTPLIVQNLLGTQHPKRTPIWFMRQAGRYLPEYQSIRAQHSLLTAMMTADLATEVTLQPLRRYDLDAAIVFADILTPLIGMGVKLDFVEGTGPVLDLTISSVSDIDRLHPLDPEQGTAATLETLANVRRAPELAGKALLGFCGAPFTLISYLCRPQGGEVVKRLMIEQADAWKRLQLLLVDSMARYLVAQVRAGADAVQIFDSDAGRLTVDQYSTSVAPWVADLISRVKRECPTTPIIYFIPGGGHLLGVEQTLGADALSVDWRIDLAVARKSTGQVACLQGNLDPELLLGTKRGAVEATRQILAQGRALSCGYIFNLGHGILPKTPVENVAAVIQAVREERGS